MAPRSWYWPPASGKPGWPRSTAPKWNLAASGLTGLTVLVLRRSRRINGAGRRHLQRLHVLRYLELVELSIEDDGLVHLAGLTNLETLKLWVGKIAGPGLCFLSGLKTLKELDYGRTKLVDEALGHVAAILSLEELQLYGAKITDKGLQALAPLQRLRFLDVTGTTISFEAIHELKRALPALRKVWWSPPGAPFGRHAAVSFRAGSDEE
jgi:hypothetical protein